MAETTQCDAAFAKHDYMLKQHDDILTEMRGVPQILAGLKEALAQLNVTISTINNTTQSRTQCEQKHMALDALRLEQLGQVHRRLDEHDTIEGTVDELKKTVDEMKGVVKFLKWAIPVAVSISPAIASLVIHLQGKH